MGIRSRTRTVHLGNNVVKEHFLKRCVLEVGPSTKHKPGTQDRAKWKEQLINLPFFFRGRRQLEKSYTRWV